MINETARAHFGLPTTIPFDSAQFPITSRVHAKAYGLAKRHKYGDHSILDVPEDELLRTVDDVSSEALRLVVQSEASSNELTVAIAKRDYIAIKNLAEGQIIRFQAIVALSELLQEGYYKDAEEKDIRMHDLNVEIYGRAEASRMESQTPRVNSVEFHRCIDDARSGPA